MVTLGTYSCYEFTASKIDNQDFKLLCLLKYYIDDILNSICHSDEIIEYFLLFVVNFTKSLSWTNIHLSL